MTRAEAVLARYHAGSEAPQIARELGMPRRTVYDQLKRAGVHLPLNGGRPVRIGAHIKAKAVALYQEGYRLRVIAEQCGISHGSVSLAVRQAGVATRTDYARRGKGQGEGAGPDPSTLLRRCPRCYGIAAGACCPNGHPFEAA